jgi:hypothetical protein
MGGIREAGFPPLILLIVIMQGYISKSLSIDDIQNVFLKEL